jgi:hypothetical protein
MVRPFGRLTAHHKLKGARGLTPFALESLSNLDPRCAQVRDGSECHINFMVLRRTCRFATDAAAFRDPLRRQASDASQQAPCTTGPT